MRSPLQNARSAVSFASALALAAACSTVACSEKVAEPEPPPKPTTTASATPDPTELKIEDITPGEGERAVKDGDKLEVLYVGRLLKTNAKFDSNEKRDAPFKFTVGEGVIEGWSKGVIGMKKGGKRKLTIPASLAYGAKGSPPKIPPNAPLVFEIELIGWQDEADAPAGSASAAASGSAGAAPSAKAAPTSSAAAEPKKELPKKKEEPKQ